MNLLLDTHAFLWFIGGDERLTDRARQTIEDGANLKVLVSCDPAFDCYSITRVW